VVRQEGDACEASLLLDGIRCAACITLIERFVARQPGVASIAVNFATRRARLKWDSARTKLSHILRAIAALGYRAYPYDRELRETLAKREWRGLLLRASLALLAMMQVMMFAVPAYVSDDGIEPQYRQLLGYASLVLTLPVVLYCAAPFFAGAWRSLRQHSLGMDVPVSLGIAAAFAASAWSTLTGSGAPVYYDSITMFVALLLVARLFEWRARQKSAEALESIARTAPDVARRLVEFPATRSAETIAAAQLREGDHVEIAAGDAIPADGVVVEGRSSVEEAILTGESWPRPRGIGDRVLAGSINRESPLIVRITAAGAATTVASLGRLVEHLAQERPRAAVLADRAAVWFVAALLALVGIAASWWSIADSTKVLPVVIAMLVASCPCALSLATPAVFAAAAGGLARRGIVVLKGEAIEAMAYVTHVVLDKTGTVTNGSPRLVKVTPLREHDAAQCIAMASALEAGSQHPLAVALRAQAHLPLVARNVAAIAGSGVTGSIDGRQYRLGRPVWVWGVRGSVPTGRSAPDAIVVALGDEAGPVALLEFRDDIRSGARELVRSLKGAGLQVLMLSGDRIETVRHVASELGIDLYQAGATPDDKCATIERLQRLNARVAMVGDGINDAPSLARADVSLCLGSAATLTQWTADVVVLGHDLHGLVDVLRTARRTLQVMRMNIGWALAYNLVAIPLAAFGYLTPVVAAAGMSLSSMFVVGNALRLLHQGRDTRPRDTAAAHPAPALAH
jgi:Cu2+-exporting ATPase